MIGEVTKDEFAKLEDGCCPDCGYRGFVLGPHGGIAINVECGNRACRSRFNLTNMGWDLVMAERIGRGEQPQ